MPILYNYSLLLNCDPTFERGSLESHQEFYQVVIPI